MIAVLDYGIGNLRSAEKALQHLGADARLITDAGEVERATAVVLPGVGAFGRCMQELRASGLDRAALAAIDRGAPFLGICVGMQMLFDGSEEAPGIIGLGVLSGLVRRLSDAVVLPHMGWNTLTVTPGSRLLAGLGDAPSVYFVHSYAPVPTDDSIVAATTDHGGRVVAAVERGSLWATQFHPEKSSTVGLAMLANFVKAADAAGAASATVSV